MGDYHNPASEEELTKIGRRINRAQKYDDAVSQLNEGEILVGLYDRGVYMCAPHLYSASEFEAFERSYRSGNFLSRTFYAVPKDKF